MQSRIAGRLAVARRFNGGKAMETKRVPFRGRLKGLRPSLSRYNAQRMSHNYYSILVHCVFSTKERRLLIPADMKERVWPYMAGIARQNKFKALAVGGMQDHAHVLLSLPPTILVAKAVQLIKGGSSKWINDHLTRRSFDWQDGYAAFSIGVSQLQNTIRYIDNQERHHAKMNFTEELEKMLERHGIQAFSRSRD